MKSNVWPELPTAKWNETFLGQYGFGKIPAADFHSVISSELDGLHIRRGSKRAWIAPRGGAKSTWTTMAYAVRCAVHNWERHILILSDSSDQAEQHLRKSRVQFEANPRLLKWYPEACGVGPIWRDDRLQLKNGVLLEALGTGKPVRGRTNEESRPSLVIVDDPQSNRDITSQAERKKAWDWFVQEVIPAGDENTNFLVVGSALHRQAIAVRAQQLAGWVGKTFSAIHSWPENKELWAEWERIATNLADDGRDKAAEVFFQANKEEMSRGSKTYWPEKWPINRLMAVRAVSHSAFDTEYQGQPQSPQGAEWPAELFDWHGFWFDKWPEPNDVVLKVQALDPSKGTGSDQSDYQAHCMVAYTSDGTLYVECDLRREVDYVKRAIEHAALFKPYELVAESNATMGLLAPELERQIAEWNATHDVPLTFGASERLQTVNKLTRMRALTPYLKRRQIRVKNNAGGRLLVEQMREVPVGDHDDGPDGLSTAVLRIEELMSGG